MAVSVAAAAWRRHPCRRRARPPKSPSASSIDPNARLSSPFNSSKSSALSSSLAASEKVRGSQSARKASSDSQTAQAPAVSSFWGTSSAAAPPREARGREREEAAAQSKHADADEWFYGDNDASDTYLGSGSTSWPSCASGRHVPPRRARRPLRRAPPAEVAPGVFAMSPTGLLAVGHQQQPLASGTVPPLPLYCLAAPGDDELSARAEEAEAAEEEAAAEAAEEEAAAEAAAAESAKESQWGGAGDGSGSGGSRVGVGQRRQRRRLRRLRRRNRKRRRRRRQRRKLKRLRRLRRAFRGDDRRRGGAGIFSVRGAAVGGGWPAGDAGGDLWQGRGRVSPKEERWAWQQGARWLS